MLKRIIFPVAIATITILLASCSGRHDSGTTRSIYYWSTAFAVDSAKRTFLSEHNISRIYVRYFDVVASPEGGFPHPNATIRIDSVPASLEQEIVPVVFVMPDALDCDRQQLASMILSRVKQMSETHGMGQLKELQIDCDWTTSTRQRFFDLMAHLKQLTETEGITLSSTIRLHQLAGDPPPADRGVLMVYNTGDMRDLSKEKPILDPNDVKPYIRYLKKFKLPLATAYPIYRWELLFRNGKFVDIVHDRDELPILPSDTIAVRQPSISDIITCKKAIESARPECAGEIILFDLNNYNILRYDSQEFETIYN